MSWQEPYRGKLRSPQEATQCIQSNMRVYIHPGCAEPETLVEALMARGPFVRNVEIVHLLTVGCAGYISPQMEGHFRHNAMFIGGNVRQAVNEGRADYTPIFLSQIENLFESGQMPLDVAYLHGRTIRQRAEALIEIAHPKFRDELYSYCEKTRWLQRPSLSETLNGD